MGIKLLKTSKKLLSLNRSTLNNSDIEEIQEITVLTEKPTELGL